MRKISLILLLFPFIALPQATTTTNNDNSYPDGSWQEMPKLMASGWDTSKFIELNKFIIDSANTTGLLAIYRGNILFQYGDVQEISYLASCRKSVISMLYGPFVENGTIQLQKTIEQLKLDDIGGLLPLEKKATIQNLLTARSGVYHPASTLGDFHEMAPKRGSMKPGSFWLYNNWDFNIAGYILEKETGKNFYDLVDSLLVKPLHMQDWKREIQHTYGDSTRSIYPAYQMWFSTRDMARIGYLMLKNGKWKDQQIIPANWVKTSTSIVTRNIEVAPINLSRANFGYSYMWWVWDKPFDTGYYKGAYSAMGSYGQFITILPELDLVIAHKTKPDYERKTPLHIYLKIVEKIILAKHLQE